MIKFGLIDRKTDYLTYPEALTGLLNFSIVAKGIVPSAMIFIVPSLYKRKEKWSLGT